jgi:hypothetical protein
MPGRADEGNVSSPIGPVARAHVTSGPAGPEAQTRPRAAEEKGVQSFARTLEIRAPAARPTTAPQPAASVVLPTKPQGPASLMRTLVEASIKADAQIDAVLESAAKGRTFSPAELLALQTQVFRYSQTVEVLSRTADRLVGGLKQTLGTQV